MLPLRTLWQKYRKKFRDIALKISSHPNFIGFKFFYNLCKLFLFALAFVRFFSTFSGNRFHFYPPYRSLKFRPSSSSLFRFEVISFRSVRRKMSVCMRVPEEDARGGSPSYKMDSAVLRTRICQLPLTGRRPDIPAAFPPRRWIGSDLRGGNA